MNDLKELPAYLVYPDDGISNMMFAGKMKKIVNVECAYSFMLYTDIAESVPEIEKQQPQFDINETHYYYKNNSSAWYSICIMKGTSVANSPLRDWVEKGDHLFTMLGAMEQALRLPQFLRGQNYTKVAMYDLEEWSAYNRLHNFDETHVYGHVFYLNDQLYKKFILLAKKNDYAWRVEVNIPSDIEEIIPPDFVPAGQTFGNFYPVLD